MGERTAPMERQVWPYAAGLVRMGKFKIAEVRAGGGVLSPAAVTRFLTSQQG